MSEQKQNERKSNNNDKKRSSSRRESQTSLSSISSASIASLSRGTQSFHTAKESVSHESRLNEPRSSYKLAPPQKLDDEDEDDERVKDTEFEKPSDDGQKFRSSVSLHHLKTIKSSENVEDDDKLKPAPLTKESTPRDSTITLMPSPELSRLGTVAAKGPNISNTSIKSNLSTGSKHSIGGEPKNVRISATKADDIAAFKAKARRSKDSSQKRTSQRSLNGAESFPTNLETGHAFVYMVLPPDGGYGWVITFVSFLVQVINDGIVFSIGVILPDVARDLQVQMTEAILISAVQICFYYLSGPLTSAFINKFGFRAVAIIGASSGAICLLISSFSPNLEMMIVFYSVLGGPSMAMTWVASQLIIGYYFEKYRSIANGLSCAGSGAGLVIFVELNMYAVPRIGWRNNMRVQAGLLVVTLLLSLAFAEVPPSKIGIIREQDPTVDISEEDEEHEVDTYNYADPTSVEPEDRAVEFIKLEKIPSGDLVALQKRTSNRFEDWINRHFCCCCRKFHEREYQDPFTKRYVIKKELIDRQDLYYTGPAEYTEHDRAAKREIIDGQDVELIETERPVHSINYSMSQFTTASRKSKEKEEAFMKEKKSFAHYINPANWMPEKIRRVLRLMFNFSLFRIMEFQVLFASAFLFALAYNIPFLFSKARLKLTQEQMKSIPMIIGVTNFFFRIICGFIAFKFKKSVVYLCGSAVVIGGLACVVSAFYGNEDYSFQIGYASFFGVAPAFYSTLRAIIYVQYLGLENLTNAFCLISMGMGFAILFGSLIGGVLNDATGNFTGAFIFAGVCIIASGILKLMLPYFSRRRQTARKVKFQV